MKNLGLTTEQCEMLILELRTEQRSVKTQKEGLGKTRKGKWREIIEDDDEDEDDEIDELGEDHQDTVESEDDVARPSATIPPIRIPASSLRGLAIGREHQPHIQPHAEYELIVRKTTPLFLPSDDDPRFPYSAEPTASLFRIGEDKGPIKFNTESLPTTPPLSLPGQDEDEGHVEFFKGKTGRFISYLICAT
jgi:hypothetical protein